MKRKKSAFEKYGDKMAANINKPLPQWLETFIGLAFEAAAWLVVFIVLWMGIKLIMEGTLVGLFVGSGFLISLPLVSWWAVWVLKRHSEAVHPLRLPAVGVLLLFSLLNTGQTFSDDSARRRPKKRQKPRGRS